MNENKNIKTIILCGGFGTRMKEETEFKPKPLVLIGGKPILWHIMKNYSHYGFNDFVLALGYKGEMIKDYFLNQRFFLNDFTLNTSTGEVRFRNDSNDNFKITFAETGSESLMGERILRVKKYITEDEFMVTFGDGIGDINLNDLVAFHRKQNKIGTITGTHPHSKYGLVKINHGDNLVETFDQKPLMYDYVSGGFMVFNKKAFDYFDKGPMEPGLIKMSKENQLSVYKHEGFWQCMDTYREMEELNKLWAENKPWAVWEKGENAEIGCCRNCGHSLISFFSLGEMPLANSFLKKEEIPQEKKYDLTVGFCPDCYLVQLINTINPEELFRNYIYFSSTSKIFLEHCEETADHLIQKLHLDSDSLVLEIASNDGSQLQSFKNRGIGILGVDPAKNIVEAANKNGILTLPEFFNFNFAKKLKEEKLIQADLVFGANVLAHVPEIVDFVKGVKAILKPKGTAVFEFPYLRGLMENKFDIIYHEHVFYYSLLALINLFKTADLEIYDADITPMQGGSLRIFISHPGVFEISDGVKNLISQEIKDGFDKIETYLKVSENVKKLKSNIIGLLADLKKAGKKVAVYSAPAKGNILLNYFNINEKYICFISDKSEAKQGLYTPGTHLMVYPIEKIRKERPDYLLVLCWNIADEIVEQFKDYHDTGGKFIVPVPEVKII